MRRLPSRFLTLNLRETYHELGEYEFKVVLHPRFYKNSHLSELTLQDSDGKPMKYDLQKWGRKMNCRFIIDNSVADGVSIAKLKLLDEKEQVTEARVTFWVIKP